MGTPTTRLGMPLDPLDQVKTVLGAGALVAADAALGAWLRSSQGDEV